MPTIQHVTVFRVRLDEGGYEDFDHADTAARRLLELEAIAHANAVIEAGGMLCDAWALDAVRLPHLPDAIRHVTKNAGFHIGHWQCCDLAVYQVSGLDNQGRLLVYGVGGCSGSYGQPLYPTELAAYPWKPVADVLNDPRNTASFLLHEAP